MQIISNMLHKTKHKLINVSLTKSNFREKRFLLYRIFIPEIISAADIQRNKGTVFSLIDGCKYYNDYNKQMIVNIIMIITNKMKFDRE